MSADREDTLRQFCDVTGADEVRSRFFLESSNWQLEVALSSFYEHGGNADEAPPNPPAAPVIPVLSDSDMESPPGSPLRTQKKDKKKPANTKFATLNTLQQESFSSDEEEDENPSKRRRKNDTTIELCCEPSSSKHKSEEPKAPENLNISSDGIFGYSYEEKQKEMERLKKEIERLCRENSDLRKLISRLKEEVNESVPGQAFYAGGSERSGQQILGPPSKNRRDIVTEMFKSVRERGAVVFEDEPSSTSRGRGGGAFSGVGHRLGATSEDQEPVTPSNTAPAPAQEQARSVRLRLYREGFTVDTGPLRPYMGQENAEFLSCIRRGEIPEELSGGGGEVRVSLEDRRHEECPLPRAQQHAFTGKGQMLGSPTPTTVGATAPVAADASDRAANQRSAQEAVGLDEAQPVTTVQFRLADGSRLTGRFNHSHTVADLQQYVSRAEPAYQLAAFNLLTTFPSAELADPGVTLAQANLLNTTLLQRLK